MLVQTVNAFEIDASLFSLKQQIKSGWNAEDFFCLDDHDWF